jgi:hypothetical protein
MCSVVIHFLLLSQGLLVFRGGPNIGGFSIAFIYADTVLNDESLAEGPPFFLTGDFLSHFLSHLEHQPQGVS